MTIVIKKGDSKEKNQKKLDLLQKRSLKRKQKSFMEFCGALKGVFKEDAVVIQRKLRDEWQ
jgi:hypothetical protein